MSRESAIQNLEKQTFSGGCATYLEDVTDNPHLERLLKGEESFDAAGNQEWFLKRISRFIEAAVPTRHLVLDQDPAGIVFGYSKMFRDGGQLGDDRYAGLIRMLIKVERSLARWKRPRPILFLDAPADVLRERLTLRWGASRTPSIAWFITVREYFQALSTRLPGAVTLSTIEMSPEEVTSCAHHLLESQ